MNYHQIFQYLFGTFSGGVGIGVTVFLCLFRWRNRFGRPAPSKPQVASWEKLGLKGVVRHITPHYLDIPHTSTSSQAQEEFELKSIKVINTTSSPGKPSSTEKSTSTEGPSSSERSTTPSFTRVWQEAVEDTVPSHISPTIVSRRPSRRLSVAPYSSAISNFR